MPLTCTLAFFPPRQPCPSPCTCVSHLPTSPHINQDLRCLQESRPCGRFCLLRISRPVKQFLSICRRCHRTRCVKLPSAHDPCQQMHFFADNPCLCDLAGDCCNNGSWWSSTLHAASSNSPYAVVFSHNTPCFPGTNDHANVYGCWSSSKLRSNVPVLPAAYADSNRGPPKFVDAYSTTAAVPALCLPDIFRTACMRLILLDAQRHVQHGNSHRVSGRPVIAGSTYRHSCDAGKTTGPRSQCSCDAHRVASHLPVLGPCTLVCSACAGDGCACHADDAASQ